MSQGKRNPSSADPAIDIVKNPHYLVLISENFMEACAVLSPSQITNLPSNQSPIKIAVTSVPPVSEPPATSVSPGLFNTLFVTITMSYLIIYLVLVSMILIVINMFTSTFVLLAANESLSNQQSVSVENNPSVTVKVVRPIKNLSALLLFPY